MKCPTDDTVLQMTDRQGIEIDYCPQCRGVWLDRGELDKLIDRSAEQPPSRPDSRSEPRSTYDQQGRSAYSSQGSDDGRRDSGHYKKRKKESFLGEMFDF